MQQMWPIGKLCNVPKLQPVRSIRQNTGDRRRIPTDKEWSADKMSREYTIKLLEMIEEGLLSEGSVIIACLKYMSEDEVKDMMEANEFIMEE